MTTKSKLCSLNFKLLVALALVAVLVFAFLPQSSQAQFRSPGQVETLRPTGDSATGIGKIYPIPPHHTLR